LCARITLDMHSLNNEGTEGNQQQTRMVTVFDVSGNKALVNAVSGDMLKHVLVEHLTPLLETEKEAVCRPAREGNPDRLNADDAFVKFAEDKKHKESDIMDRILKDCAVTDIAGTLVTRGRSVGRKSAAEFGWVVGVPGSVATEHYFHVKYAPEGREKAAGDDTVAGKQAIFHRPASSGLYALVCNLELDRVGLNDINRRYAVDAAARTKRGRSLIRALMATLLAPKGAQRNTQNPHIVDASGVVAVSSSTLPAPTISPLNPEYESAMEEIARTLGSIAGTVQVRRFATLAEGAQVLASYAAEYEAVA
jgi:CRISPR-associated protein Cst2